MPILGILASSFAAAGDYESIATVTVGSGGASSVTFSSIPSTYAHLQIRYTARQNTFGALWLTYNGDTSVNNYTTHRLFGDGTAVTSQGWGTGTFKQFVSGIAGNTDLANTFGVGVVDILDYANTSKFTTSRSLSGVDFNGFTPHSGQIFLSSGLWVNTAAVTSILIEPQNPNFLQHSTFALYGIKGA